MEMLITQALDERDLLKKKIEDAIASNNFVSVRKVGKAIDIRNAPVDKVIEDMKSSYQSINDMIDRYYTIIQKIAESNAKTLITVNGKEMTISAAISILKDLSNREYFKLKLLRKLTNDYENAFSILDRNNKNVEVNKQTLLNNLISRNSDGGKNKPVATDEEVELINKTIEKDYTEFIDPLDITEKIKVLKDEDATLKANILSAIKISNATTVIDL